STRDSRRHKPVQFLWVGWDQNKVQRDDRNQWPKGQGGGMAKTVVMDELHLTVRAPRGLPEAEYDAIHEALTDRHFLARLRRAIRAVFRHQPTMVKTKAILSR